MEASPTLFDGVAIPPPEAPPRSVVHTTFTYEDVAAFKKVQRHTVYKWVRNGCIPSPVYTAGTARFTSEQVAEIMSASMTPGTYKRAASMRATAAKKATKKRLKATGKPPAKKKPAPKKPAPKKKGAKK